MQHEFHRTFTQKNPRKKKQYFIPRTDDLYDLYDLYYLFPLHGLDPLRADMFLHCDLYDLYDLYDLAHVAG